MQKKIVFMGTPEFSVEILEVLFKSKFDIACVYTQPPKKSERGQKINESQVHLAAKKLNLQVRVPKNLNTEEEYQFFKSLNPFIAIVVAYGKIIPKRYLSLSSKGFLNVHASLLPKWRGAAPIQRSIMNKEKETGISFMKISEGLDVGPYMKQIKIEINTETNTKSLSKKLSNLGAENILECLNLIETGKAEFVSQNEKIATYAKKIEKKESKIIWQDTAQNIIAKINGLNPSPGAWFEYNGSRYKVWKAVVANHVGKPGEILDEKFIIACKDRSIKILEIQKEGKTKLPIDNFLAGNKILKGEIIF